MNKIFSCILSFLFFGLLIVAVAHSSLAALPAPETTPTIPAESNPMITSSPTSGCQEVPLPKLFGLEADPCSSPAAYIQYWFYFSLYLAGIAALLALVLAGAWRIFFATSPSSVSKSNQWVINAVLGLILLFGSWLLLRTLGGSGLTTLKDVQLPTLPDPGKSTIPENGKGGENCSFVGPSGPLPSPQGSCATGLECVRGTCWLPGCDGQDFPISLCTNYTATECVQGDVPKCCEVIDGKCDWKNP